MVMQDTAENFWRRLEAGTPGMVNTGVGLFGDRLQRREAKGILNEAQGPDYQAMIAASRGALGQAGTLDPKAAAAERFAAQQGLLKGKDAADEMDLMRRLQATGMLGVASFDPGKEAGALGVAPPTGAPINPQLAALYAARGARDARMSADALEAGEGQIDRMLKRSAGLQEQANAQRANTIAARNTVPSRSVGLAQLLRGATGVAKDTGLLRDFGGMLRGGLGWLGGKTGWWGGDNGPELLNNPDWSYTANPDLWMD